MDKPTDDDSPRNGLPPLAFIYDHRTNDTAVGEDVLRLRLAACREYAEQQGWELAGEWIDRGDAALTTDRRPQFDVLLGLIRHHAAHRPVVCLIGDWDRLANRYEPQRTYRRRVKDAGGWTETAVGESDRDPLRQGSLAAFQDGS